MANAVCGIMIEPKTRAKSGVRPRNRNFAKAYPAIVATKVAPTALTTE